MQSRERLLASSDRDRLARACPGKPRLRESTPTSKCSPSRRIIRTRSTCSGRRCCSSGTRSGGDHLERAARARRNHPGVLGNLAQAYFALARYADARETFRKASRLDPGAAQFQLGIANSLAMEGRLGRGRDAAAAARSRFPARRARLVQSRQRAARPRPTGRRAAVLSRSAGDRSPRISTRATIWAACCRNCTGSRTPSANTARASRARRTTSREVQSRFGADRRRPFQGSRGGAARGDCRRSRAWARRTPISARRSAVRDGCAKPSRITARRRGCRPRVPVPSKPTWRR